MHKHQVSIFQGHKPGKSARNTTERAKMTRQARTSLGVKFLYHSPWEVCCFLFAKPNTGRVTGLPQQQWLLLRETMQLLLWFLSQGKGISPQSQLL